MDHKKYMFAIAMLICLVTISMVSAVKPVSTVTLGNKGLAVESTVKDYLRTGEAHDFEVHVFNISDGKPIVSGITCYMHLYGDKGTHIFTGLDNTVSHDFDYGFDLTGTNFTSRGEYQAKFQCNNSLIGGGQEIFFVVNDYGEELTPARASTFNWSMMFMMILFLSALIGLFTINHYIGKFALYWVVHLLFVIGTFSVWQFNQGYAIAFFGLASIWKVMFYVSIIAVFPMIILSLAWIFYIHTFNEHFQKLIDNGGNTEDAFRMAKRKSGGWFGGK